MTRTLLGCCALAAAVAALAAGCGGSGSSSGANGTIQREANLWQIDQIEAKFHRATSYHDLNLMMSLWAPGAVFNIDGATLTGKDQIRQWFATQSKAFKPGDVWESDTPSYKIRINLTGDKATMYFECHYVDPKTQKVVSWAGVTHTLQKIKGKWLIVDSASSNPTLSAH